MLTGGVDLSTDPKKTATATIDWSRAKPEVELPDLPRGDDEYILELTSRVEKLGIDCPLGWPATFVDFVKARHDRAAPLEDRSGKELREDILLRHTDRFVADHSAARPLRVAADRLGATATRVAILMSLLARRGDEVDRRGNGVIVEVYPAASLAAWEIDHQGYKGTGDRAKRSAILDQLVTRVGLEIKAVDRNECVRSDHVLDAVVAALTARAKHLDLVHAIEPDAEEPAAREGWIALPTAGSLEQLAQPDR